MDERAVRLTTDVPRITIVASESWPGFASFSTGTASPVSADGWT